MDLKPVTLGELLFSRLANATLNGDPSCELFIVSLHGDKGGIHVECSYYTVGAHFGVYWRWNKWPLWQNALFFGTMFLRKPYLP